MIAQALAMLTLWQVALALVCAGLLVGAVVLYRDGRRRQRRVDARVAFKARMQPQWDKDWSDYSEHARDRRKDVALTRIERDIAAVSAKSLSVLGARSER